MTKGNMNKITAIINDICTIWIDETKKIVRDEGLLIFTVLLPLLYPLLYSWIYNNEVVRDVPVAVVDNSDSKLSRKLTSMLDASPDVETAYRCGSLEEARRLIGLQEVYGVIYIPEDFETRISRMEQSTVSLYCNMALMLTYKAIYQTTTTVIGEINSDIQKSVSGNHTDREDEITTSPINIEEVAMFNSTGGYGSFILPGVLILIIQQVLLLSIGMRNGTVRERRPSKIRNMFAPKPTALLPVVAGKTLCYLSMFTVLATYVLLGIPRIFNFIHTVHPGDFAMFLLPYLLACIFFAMTISVFMKEREEVMLLVVFTSVPLLFISGISWPATNIPEFWKYVSYIFPSTFGIQAFIKMNSMGATFSDIKTEYICLWIQSAVYLITACMVYRKMAAETKDSRDGKKATPESAE